MRQFFISVIILTLFSSCLQPVMDHAVVEFTLPDRSIETINIGMNNYVLIHHGDRQYVMRGKTIHENSIDLEVVECTATMDTNTKEYNILKLDSQLRHFVVGKEDVLLGDKSEIRVNISSLAELTEGNALELICHANKGCCYASCSLRMCCTGGPGACHDAACDCSITETCVDQSALPDIFSYAKLFSREKLNVRVKV